MAVTSYVLFLPAGCFAFAHSGGAQAAMRVEAERPGTFAAVYAFEPVLWPQNLPDDVRYLCLFWHITFIHTVTHPYHTHSWWLYGAGTFAAVYAFEPVLWPQDLPIDIRWLSPLVLLVLLLSKSEVLSSYLIVNSWLPCMYMKKWICLRNWHVMLGMNVLTQNPLQSLHNPFQSLLLYTQFDSFEAEWGFNYDHDWLLILPQSYHIYYLAVWHNSERLQSRRQ